MKYVNLTMAIAILCAAGLSSTSHATTVYDYKGVVGESVFRDNSESLSWHGDETVAYLSGWFSLVQFLPPSLGLTFRSPWIRYAGDDLILPPAPVLTVTMIFPSPIIGILNFSEEFTDQTLYSCDENGCAGGGGGSGLLYHRADGSVNGNVYTVTFQPLLEHFWHGPGLYSESESYVPYLFEITMETDGSGIGKPWELVVSTPSDAPEPATWGIVLAGLGMVGLAIRGMGQRQAAIR